MYIGILKNVLVCVQLKANLIRDRSLFLGGGGGGGGVAPKRKWLDEL